ncbi:MAG: helix-turn-helix domain-containing protein [Verrucomicrobiota bacterium]|jgi:hypothetical protein
MKIKATTKNGQEGSGNWGNQVAPVAPAAPAPELPCAAAVNNLSADFPVAAVPPAPDLPHADAVNKIAADLPAVATPPGQAPSYGAVAKSFPDDLPHFVNTLAETALVLRCSEKSVRRLVDRNLLSASKGLRHLRITRQSILAYLAKTSNQ